MNNSPHQASFSIQEFESLVNDFRNHKAVLLDISYRSGPNVLIKLREIEERGLLNELGDELFNIIYNKAYVKVSYNRKKNFSSVWFQLNGILNLPKSKVYKVLEVGPGIGLMKSLISNFEYDYHTFDIDETYNPSIQGNIVNMPCDDNSFDLICAFQVMQHIPSSELGIALSELHRVAKKYVFLSLPCNMSSFNLNLEFSSRNRLIHRFNFKYSLFKIFTFFSFRDRDEKTLKDSDFCHHRHYWEVGLKSFSKNKLLHLFIEKGFVVLDHYHNPDHPYHWFIMLEKKS